MQELTTRRTFTFGPCLGRGGFGEVYRASMRSGGGLDSAVAVKILRVDVDADTDAVRRLRDEGRLLARLNHPTILTVYDLVLLDGRVALVTEFVDGADLDTCLRADPPLSPRALLDAIGQVAAALDAAWRTPGPDGRPLRIVHRDLKPSNVRIGRHGQVRLLDFGIAHFVADDREARTASDLIVGSVPYMAPERFFQRDTGAAADVYGLGCLLYEGLAGQRFFGRSEVRHVSRAALAADQWTAHLRDRMAAIADRPAALRALVASCLTHEPSARPSAAEVAERCDTEADALSGPSLRSWARRWPVRRPPEQPGPLEGRVISEGSLGLTGDAMPDPIDEATVILRARPTLDLGGVAPVASGGVAPVATGGVALVPGPVLPPAASPPTIHPSAPETPAAPARKRTPVSRLALGSGCVVAALTLLATGAAIGTLVWVNLG